MKKCYPVYPAKEQMPGFGFEETGFVKLIAGQAIGSGKIMNAFVANMKPAKPVVGA